MKLLIKSSSDLVKSIQKVVGVKRVRPGMAPFLLKREISFLFRSVNGSSLIKMRFWSRASFFMSVSIAVVGLGPRMNIPIFLLIRGSLWSVR